MESKRLKFRHFGYEDLDDMYEWTSDDEVSKYVTWNTHKNKVETKEFLDFIINKTKSNKNIFAITLKSELKVIGMIDVVNFDEHGIPEIGYVLNRKYWNKGYMTEALKFMVAHLFKEGYKKVEISAMVENIASNKVIQKVGFKFVEKVDFFCKIKNKTVKINEYEIINV